MYSAPKVQSTSGRIPPRFSGNAALPTKVTARGTVSAADSDPVYGHYVVVSHAGGLETMYGHNAVLLVERGETVARGQPIAYSGNSGRSTAPHLHYEIRRAGRAIDPAPYLR